MAYFLLFILFLINNIYCFDIVSVNDGENVNICICDFNITSVNWTFTPHNYNVFSYTNYNIPIHNLSLPIPQNFNSTPPFFNLISITNGTSLNTDKRNNIYKGLSKRINPFNNTCLNITNVSYDDSGLYIAFYYKNNNIRYNYTAQLNVNVRQPTIDLKAIVINNETNLCRVLVTCDANHITSTASIFLGNMYVGKTALLSEIRYVNTNKTLFGYNYHPHNINYDEISLSLYATINKLEPVSDNYTYYCSVKTHHLSCNVSLDIKHLCTYKTYNNAVIKESSCSNIHQIRHSRSIHTNSKVNKQVGIDTSDIIIIIVIVCILLCIFLTLYLFVKWDEFIKAFKNIKLRIINILFRRSFTPLNNVYYTEENQVGVNVE
ncbi:F5L membrane protein [Eptesipox virus]|uniref:F5L membrane protein n=1 Tax=Eptesipox virus TaxID=1329402 RepID=A0A220T676_9POXV|nr:F5L membrane protein [Eptesipox virus]ASK51221.1 F5L membrane protein [Eptesipox virus]WAH70979.1 F5L membrane protein [Eptesipox virus]